MAGASHSSFSAMGSLVKLAVGSSSTIQKKSDFSWPGARYWNEERRERDGGGIVWIDVGRSRRTGMLSEERVEEEPVSDRKDSCFGVSDGELSDDRSMKNDLLSGDDRNGSMG